LLPGASEGGRWGSWMRGTFGVVEMLGTVEGLRTVQWKCYVRWKGYVRQAVAAQRGTGVSERAKGGIAPPFAIPAPGQQPRRFAVPSPPSPRFSLSRPQARVHAGLTWLVNYASAMLMPDQGHHCYYSERFSKSALLPRRGFHPSRVSPGRGFV